MEFLTDFADQAVMLPLAVVVAVALALGGWWRGLYGWLLVVVGVLGSIAVMKYVFFACEGVLGDTGIRSPSGHTAASTTIYGGGLILALKDRLRPAWLAVIPVVVALVFGVSRIAVGAHSLDEVLIGAGVGLAGAGLLAILAGQRPPLRMWPVAAGAMAVMVVFHGLRLQGEDIVHNFALFTWLPLPMACRA